MSKEQDTICKLVEKAIDLAIIRGAYAGLPVTPSKLMVLHAQHQSRVDLLAAIDRLERKAATAKAECDAWRRFSAAMRDATAATDNAEQHKAQSRFKDATVAVCMAITATDEAWREQAQEHQS